MRLVEAINKVKTYTLDVQSVEFKDTKIQEDIDLRANYLNEKMRLSNLVTLTNCSTMVEFQGIKINLNTLYMLKDRFTNDLHFWRSLINKHDLAVDNCKNISIQLETVTNLICVTEANTYLYGTKPVEQSPIQQQSQPIVSETDND